MSAPKFAFCHEMLADAGLDFGQQCEFLARCGYQGIELAPHCLGDMPHRMPASQAAALARVARDAGLEITGLHWLLTAYPTLSITEPVPQVRDVLKGLVDLCAALGGSVMIHGSPKNRVRPEGMDQADLTDRLAQVFAPVAEHAGAAGITYCIEALDASQTRTINTMDEAAALIGQVAHPAFRGMLDTRSASKAEALALPDLIARHRDIIAHVHLNDQNARVPGAGDDDFVPVLAALRDYSGWLSVEPFAATGRGILVDADDTLTYLKAAQ